MIDMMTIMVLAAANPGAFDQAGFFESIAVWATEGVLAITVLGQIYLWKSHYDFKTHVSDNYVKSGELMSKVNGLDTDIKEVRKTMNRILELVAELRGSNRVGPAGTQ